MTWMDFKIVDTSERRVFCNTILLKYHVYVLGGPKNLSTKLLYSKIISARVARVCMKIFFIKVKNLNCLCTWCPKRDLRK